ncbi:cupin domain-containing protein [Noviherbaspirillum malthae]|uniref:cupin domain-containing protein n=1 Tax=Noviherbaspirillum malthae TaxID=1260987 RepID=UPI00188F029D|nr:cupin domain-containing protein [Noviherbaspirillum malthae]
MTELCFPRLIADVAQGTRFETVMIPVIPKQFAPPAPSFSVSSFETAAQCGFLHLPVGWVGEQHPSPSRMWIYVLTGQMDFEASNADVRHILPGSALLLEDTTGEGHSSRVVGDQPVTLAIVRLPE